MKPLKAVSFLAVFITAVLFSTQAFAAIDSYLVFKDANGKVTKVAIDKDGKFTTPPLVTGIYSFSWGVGRGISSPAGGSAHRESSAPSVSEITVTYVIKSPRDIASGLPTGKRQYQPVIIRKTIDKASPLLARASASATVQMGSITLDKDCDGITGMVSFKDASGKPIKGGWDIKTNSK